MRIVRFYCQNMRIATNNGMKCYKHPSIELVCVFCPHDSKNRQLRRYSENRCLCFQNGCQMEAAILKYRNDPKFSDRQV